MTAVRKTALVVCPGRGSYNKPELGYLGRFHQDKTAFLDLVDSHRKSLSQPTVTELDSRKRYSHAEFSRGDNASLLIFACSYTDFMSIDAERYEVVAVTGNSMGWYTTLACGGALAPRHAIDVVNSMGNLTHKHLIGAQTLFSLVDEDWRPIPGRRAELMAIMDEINGQDPDTLFISIELGGVLVLAGSDQAVDSLIARGPKGPGALPMKLQNHAAFHSPFMRQTSQEAKASLPPDWLQNPAIPMIDGRGKIWRPYATDAGSLWDYTFGTQVVETYDFTTAMRVAMREFAPDCVITLGPGDALGGAVAQCLIALDGYGFDSKAGFIELQKDAPVVLSMGREAQREMTVKKDNSP